MLELSPNALKTLKSYTLPGEDIQSIFERVARAYGSDAAHAERMYSYMAKKWFMPASPILLNGGTDRGLPISCYLNYCDDSRDGIAKTLVENFWMGTNGGGIGTYFGAVRSKGQITSRGVETTGAMQFMHVFDSLKLAANQGNARQASNAMFMPVDHPEIEEYIMMKKKQGDIHRKNEHLDFGVCLPDKFMEAAKTNAPWDLVDPHTKQVIKTVNSGELWESILEMKMDVGKGEPYIFWPDRANEKLHPDLKAQGMKIYGSNLCMEIMLATAPDYTNVCCLSSVIVEQFDEWGDDPLFIGDCIEFLDNVMQDFIERCPPELSRARKAAIWERSLGLGQMGWHSFTQKHMIPWGSPAAYGYNKIIAKNIYENAWIRSRRLAETRGKAEGLTSDRNAHLIAIAPNAKTAIFANTSPTIEPWDSNYFMQDAASGSMPTRNDRYLGPILEQYYGSNADDAWIEILQNEGSVKTLDKLPEEVKAVFRTPYEMDQRILVKMAADRQPYICQSQSLNVFFPPKVDRAYVDEVFWLMYESGLKSQYYTRTKSSSNGSDSIVSMKDDNDCFACSG